MITVYCNVCDEEFSHKRYQLGYRVCLECGEEQANREKLRKSKCTAPLFNKGAYGYIISKRDAKDVGK